MNKEQRAMVNLLRAGIEPNRKNIARYILNLKMKTQSLRQSAKEILQMEAC